MSKSIMKDTTHVFATRRGINLFFGALLHMGAMCPKCSFGTKVINKKWAQCKKCGDKIERKKLP